MANWKYTLGVVAEWKQAKSGGLTPAEFGHAVAGKLRKLPKGSMSL